MNFQTRYSLVILLFVQLGFAQRPEPAQKQSFPIVIQGGTIHTGTGEIIENSNILLQDGLIKGFNTPIPTSAQIINADGKHIYPGFILVNNTLGLVEIEATNATIDYREVTDFSPEVRTAIAFNTDSHVIPTVRTNGILLAQPVMKNGIITGTSSVMNLDAWNWEDGVVALDNGLQLFWPQKETRQENNRAEKREEEVNRIKSLLERAKVYDYQGNKDFKLEAIQPIFTGQKKLFVEIPSADEGLEVLELVRKLEIPNVVFMGESNLEPILSYIKEANIPLIIKRPHSLPPTESSSPNAPYKFAKIVSDMGILYGLDYSGDMEFQGSRNLPFVAGTTVTYGVDKEKAIQSISLNLAKILGIDDRYGSIEAGKSATLFISDGDALDPITNNVTHAFIDGRMIDLNNQQKKLYRRYKEKYEKQTK